MSKKITPDNLQARLNELGEFFFRLEVDNLFDEMDYFFWEAKKELKKLRKLKLKSLNPKEMALVNEYVNALATVLEHENALNAVRTAAKLQNKIGNKIDKMTDKLYGMTN